MAYDPLVTPIDFVTFNGVKTPGLATVEKADAPVHWDERQGYGLAGAFPIGGWRKLTHFVVKVRIFTSVEWAAWWSTIAPILARTPPGKRPKAINVWHPWLAAKKITAAVVENELQPVQTEPGVYEIEIPMLEWRGPKIALVKPDAAAPTVPLDPVEQQIKDNMGAIAKLSAQLDALSAGKK